MGMVSDRLIELADGVMGILDIDDDEDMTMFGKIQGWIMDNAGDIDLRSTPEYVADLFKKRCICKDCGKIVFGSKLGPNCNCGE